MIKQKKEKRLQVQVATWLKYQHPEIIFRSDFAAGIKMTKGQAVLHKSMQHSRGYPDMFIAHVNRINCGLFLELKKDRGEVYNKNGSIRKNEHIQEQYMTIRELNKRGYAAYFACGFDEAIKIITDYLNNKI